MERTIDRKDAVAGVGVPVAIIAMMTAAMRFATSAPVVCRTAGPAHTGITGAAAANLRRLASATVAGRRRTRPRIKRIAMTARTPADIAGITGIARITHIIGRTSARTAQTAERAYPGMIGTAARPRRAAAGTAGIAVSHRALLLS